MSDVKIKDIAEWMQSVSICCDREIDRIMSDIYSCDSIDYWEGRKQLAHEIMDTVLGDL